MCDSQRDEGERTSDRSTLVDDGVGFRFLRYSKQQWDGEKTGKRAMDHNRLRVREELRAVALPLSVRSPVSRSAGKIGLLQMRGSRFLPTREWLPQFASWSHAALRFAD